VFPTALETVAVERLVTAKVYLDYIETQCAKAEGEITSARFWLLRLQQAHRNYHSAVKSLLLVRELLPPAGLPTALTTNGNSRFVVSMNGNSSASGPTAVASAIRNHGAGKNGNHKALAAT
jgi:hypothetical protein